MRRMGWVFAVAAVTALSGCSKPASEAGSTGAPSAQAPAAPATPTDAEVKALLATLPAPYDTGDLANGKAKFALCRSCHTVEAGGANMTGPNLHGIFGRAAAAHDDYRFSDALKGAGVVWEPATLDTWLADPRSMVPGTKMSFVGLKDAKDRADVIAYLKVATH